jgi:transposase-like protein
MKHCTQCKKDRVPEGGVALSPNRWLCANCWLRFSQMAKPPASKQEKEIA